MRSAILCRVAVVLTVFLSGVSCAPNGESVVPPPQGLYLGQAPPDAEPRLFAPGIVSTGLYDRDIAVTPDGKEIFFCVQGASFSYGRILSTRQLADATWTSPEVVSFSGPFESWDLEPFVTPDGGRLLFASNRPSEEGEEESDADIFVVDRTQAGWGGAERLGPPVCSDDDEFFPALTNDGTIYFTRAAKGNPVNSIYRSRLVDGHYGEPELLPEQVNAGRNRFNAMIAPDESFIILSVMGLPQAFGRTDYYVVFRNQDDTWSDPINLGERVNAPDSVGYSPALSPDGRYLFFMSTRTNAFDRLRGQAGTRTDLLALHNEPGNGNPDTYWIDASFIEALRPL